MYRETVIQRWHRDPWSWSKDGEGEADARCQVTKTGLKRGMRGSERITQIPD